MKDFDLAKHIVDTGFRERAIVKTGEYRPGFTLTLKFVDKNSATKLLNDAMDVKFIKGKRDVQFNEERYAELLSDVIIGWTGLRAEHVAEMCLASTEGLPDELPFTPESAKTLLLHDQTGLADFIVGHMRDSVLARDSALEKEKKT